MKHAFRLGLFTCTTWLFIGQSQAQPGQDEIIDVIVRFKQTVKADAQKRLAIRGSRFKQSLTLIDAAVYSMSRKELEALKNDPSVELAEPDHDVQATAYTGTPDFGWTTVFNSGKGTGFNYSVTGKDVTIAVIDSGVNLKTADLYDRVIASENFVSSEPDATDTYGHGTHVAGILAGNGASSPGWAYDYTIRGIAPGAKIVSLKVLDAKGGGKDSSVILAIQRAVALKVQVINLSLGRPVRGPLANDTLCQAVAAAWKAGVVVVVAAGNEGRNNSLGTRGYASIASPANSPYVITVGASNTRSTLATGDDRMTSYSSKGPTLLDHIAKPDLVAPGNRVLSLRQIDSTLDREHPENQVQFAAFGVMIGSLASPAYYQLSGTSMAAPMVSGAVALMLEKAAGQKINLTPDQIKARLMKTATRYAPTTLSVVDPVSGASYLLQNDIFTVGAGQLNIPAAIANTDLATKPALSPKIRYDLTKKAYYIVTTKTAVWGDSAVWGVTAVWGDSAVWGDNSIWGVTAVWGDSAVWGDTAVWGDSAVWGEASSIAINGEN